MPPFRVLSILGLALLLTACDRLPDRQQEQPDRNERPAPPPRQVAPGDFRDVVDASLSSIVFIQAEAAPPEVLERLLPELDFPDRPMPIGMGSGVIFSADGYILTNNHVVQDAERVLVVLHDRRLFEAEVIGRDPSTEVAVVRIRGNGLTPAELGDSDAVHLGDWVLAMGSPLGLEFSVTAGIVSGTGRAVGIIGGQMGSGENQTAPIEHFIQTDAALSPGNSGGPLVNAGGQVIGINTAIAAQPGVPSSIGLAIPSNLARDVAQQLIDFGEVRRPYLGVSLTNVTPTHAREHGLDRVEGAAIMQVEPGSPADRAGLVQGDIVLGIADERIVTVSDLQAILTRQEPEQEVTLSVLRNGREQSIQVIPELRTAGGAP